MPETVPHDAIVLAGGGGTRLGGTDKAALVVAGRTLLDRVLEATTRARRVVVVGPVEVPAGVRPVVEDPPGGGPVAGVVAGLAELPDHRHPSPWTLVLAVDQPDAARAVPALLAAAGRATPETDLLCHQDTGGHPQWLLAAYRTTSLARAVTAVGTGHGTSVRRLVTDLRIQPVSHGSGHIGDIDTWDDHASWQRRLGPAGPEPEGRSGRPRGRLDPQA